MTNFNRSTLPDTVRSNGATPNPRCILVPSRIPTATASAI